MKKYIEVVKNAIQQKDARLLTLAVVAFDYWLRGALDNHPLDFENVKDGVSKIIKNQSEKIPLSYQQLQGALNRCKKEPEFCNVFQILLCLTDVKRSKDEDNSVNGKSIYCLSRSFINEFSETHRSAQIKLLDFSFLNKLDETHNQSVLGKSPKQGKKYPNIPTGWLTTLKIGYWAVDAEGKVPLLNSKEKKELKIRRHNDGVLRRTIDQGKPLRVGTYLYALSPKGGLYAQTGQYDTVSSEGKQLFGFHHSSFRAGQPVICAGHIDVDKDGEIISIDSGSGHYGPQDSRLLIAALWLYETGIIKASCQVKFYHKVNWGLKNGDVLTVNDILTMNEFSQIRKEYQAMKGRPKSNPEQLRLGGSCTFFSPLARKLNTKMIDSIRMQLWAEEQKELGNHEPFALVLRRKPN